MPYRAVLRGSEHRRGHPQGRALARLGLRLLTALLLAVAGVSVGIVGLLMPTLPRPLAVVLQPLCLLLLPGIVPSLLIAGSHDFSPEAVLAFTMFFHTGAWFWWLQWRSWSTRLRVGNDAEASQ